MTALDVQVLVMVAVIAVGGVTYVNWLERRLDRQLGEEEKERRARRAKPAE